MPEQSAHGQPPPKFPSGVRFIQEADRDAMFDFCMAVHPIDGWGGVNPEIVHDVIGRCIKRDGMTMAVIGSHELIEAAIGFHPIKLVWYGDENSWVWSELLLNVREPYRRSRHGWKLFRFAVWFEANTDLPVLISLMPNGDMARKAALFGRFGKHISSSYMIDTRAARHATMAEAA